MSTMFADTILIVFISVCTALLAEGELNDRVARTDLSGPLDVCLIQPFISFSLLTQYSLYIATLVNCGLMYLWKLNFSPPILFSLKENAS